LPGEEECTKGGYQRDGVWCSDAVQDSPLRCTERATSGCEGGRRNEPLSTYLRGLEPVGANYLCRSGILSYIETANFLTILPTLLAHANEVIE